MAPCPPCRAALTAEWETTLRADLATLITYAEINDRKGNKAQAATCRVRAAGIGEALKALREVAGR